MMMCSSWELGRECEKSLSWTSCHGDHEGRKRKMRKGLVTIVREVTSGDRKEHRVTGRETRWGNKMTIIFVFDF